MEHSFFLCLINLESEDTRLLQNVRNSSPSDTAPYPSRPESSSQCSLCIVLMGEIFGTDKFLLYQDSVFIQVLLYLPFVFCTLRIIDESKFQSVCVSKEWLSFRAKNIFSPFCCR
jgi:hypothetical protein